MASSATRKIAREIREAAGDIQHTVRKAVPRLREDGQEMLSRAARDVILATRQAASRARRQSKSVALRAVREVRARPVAAGAIVAAVAALIGLAFLQRGRRA